MTAAVIRGAAAVLIAAAFALGATPAAAEAPARRDALVLLRVLAYDKQLPQRSGDTIVIAVAYSPADDATLAERDAWLDALGAVKRIKVAGRPVVTVAVAYDDAITFDRRVAYLAPSAMVVCDALDDDIPELHTVTRRRKVLTFGRHERDVRAGLAVAVVSGTQRDRIVINLAAARAEGAVFAAGLLQIARLVEDR